MKIYLEKDVSDLGVKGEIVEVAPGYFFNFLFPKGLAGRATKTKIAQAKKKAIEIKKRKKEETKQAKELADKLLKKDFIVKKTATEDGQLYAKVSPEEVIEVLGEDNIKPGMIVFKQEIKKIGQYTVKINLTSKISAQLKLKVETLEEQSK